MAGKPRAGRKPAKNETAAALINALNFCAVIKAPTTTSLPQHWHVWFNQGVAISYDGIVAAGHPIPEGIAGYPHAKLLLEALENTDKSFELTVRENGAFDVQSDKYQALVPSLDPSQVISTIPDRNQGPFNNGAAFIAAVDATSKITTESGDVVLYSAIRLSDTGTVMATDGNTIIEAYHGNQTPPGIILPKQFATALVKVGKVPIGMGLGHNWDTFTVWFEDGSWLRTALYPSDTWPNDVTNTFYQLVEQRVEPSDIAPKLWTALKALLPFTDDDNRVIIRPGLLRTHMDRRIGAALELAEIPVSLDIDGKRLASVESLATRFLIGSAGDLSTFVFYGDKVRGVIVGLPELDEPEAPETTNGGWETAGSGDGWAMAGPAVDKQPAQGWHGIPANGLAGDVEYESARQDIPADQLSPPVDQGVSLGGFNSSAFLEGLKDVGE